MAAMKPAANASVAERLYVAFVVAGSPEEAATGRLWPSWGDLPSTTQARWQAVAEALVPKKMYPKRPPPGDLTTDVLFNNVRNLAFTGRAAENLEDAWLHAAIDDLLVKRETLADLVRLYSGSPDRDWLIGLKSSLEEQLTEKDLPWLGPVVRPRPPKRRIP
jgi:hypothetical protein